MRTLLLIIAMALSCPAQPRARDLGIRPGVLEPGALNAITDVAGVRVGHVTLMEGESVRTGVTAIVPHGGNLFQQKLPAAIFAGNGFGKLAGVTQVRELGNLESPVVLTNTLSVAEGIAGVVEYTLAQPGNESVVSVNAVVGETNDSRLNDIRRRFVTKQHVMDAIVRAKAGPVEEGAVGAGTGTVAFGFKGGIGTSSRRLPASLGGHTVGVLVQTNYGGILTMDGVPVGKELGQYYLKDAAQAGSCMIVVATDAPVDARNLERLGARALLGLGVTGSSLSNGSGDYAVAFSTVLEGSKPLLSNEQMSPLFQAVKEATEEAVYNSLLQAKTMTGHGGRVVEALPLERVRAIFGKYGRALQ